MPSIPHAFSLVCRPKPVNDGLVACIFYCLKNNKRPIKMRVCGPVIGVLVDRWNRKAVMMTADIVVAAAAGTLAIAAYYTELPVGLVMAVLFIRSIGGGKRNAGYALHFQALGQAKLYHSPPRFPSSKHPQHINPQCGAETIVCTYGSLAAAFSELMIIGRYKDTSHSKKTPFRVPLTVLANYLISFAFCPWRNTEALQSERRFQAITPCSSHPIRMPIRRRQIQWHRQRKR